MLVARFSEMAHLACAAAELPLTEADVPAPTTPRGILLREGELLATGLFDALAQQDERAV